MSNGLSKAVELLQDILVAMPDYLKAPWTKVGPGGVIEKLSQEKRDVLKQLTSDDLAKIRPDTMFYSCVPDNTRKETPRWR